MQQLAIDTFKLTLELIDTQQQKCLQLLDIGVGPDRHKSAMLTLLVCEELLQNCNTLLELINDWKEGHISQVIIILKQINFYLQREEFRLSGVMFTAPQARSHIKGDQRVKDQVEKINALLLMLGINAQEAYPKFLSPQQQLFMYESAAIVLNLMLIVNQVKPGLCEEVSTSHLKEPFQKPTEKVLAIMTKHADAYETQKDEFARLWKQSECEYLQFENMHGKLQIANEDEIRNRCDKVKNNWEFYKQFIELFDTPTCSPVITQ